METGQVKNRTAAEAQGILSRLSDEVGSSQFQRYFDRQARVLVREGGVDVTVPSEFVARLLDRRFGEQIRRAAGTGEVRFRVDREAFEHGGGGGDGKGGPPEPAAAGNGALPPVRTAVGAGASGRPPRVPATPLSFRFEDFVVGASNRMAHSAAVRIAEDQTAAGSVFIHGGCGMGKTHLLQSIAARFMERNPGAGVRYTTAEAFTNDYISAIRANRVDAFRKMYRRVDLLCLDDVHFLSNKEATQNELLHTFDAIGMDGARVVLASDEHPREIAEISERLVSRFLAGTLARIEAPDAELRERLVRHLARKRGLNIEEPGVKLISERSARSLGRLDGFGGSVREIDGLLIQVEAMCRLLPEYAGASAGLLVVRKALGLDTQTAPGRPRRPIHVDAITSEVCRSLSVDITELMGRGRHKRVVLARALCGHLCRRLTTLSYPEIAKGMGRPNHSTIITACKRLDEHMAAAKEIEPDIALGLTPDLRGMTLRQIADALADRVLKAAV